MESTTRHIGEAWSTPVTNLMELAVAGGITLVPFAEAELEAEKAHVMVDPLAAMTDGQVVRAYLDAVNHRTMRPGLEQAAIKAARALGEDGLLKLGARLKRQERLLFWREALAHSWLSASRHTLDALGKGMHPLSLLECAERHGGVDDSVDVNYLTRWAGKGKGGISEVAWLWTRPVCPAGLVDHDVVTSINLNGPLASGSHTEQSGRLVRKSVDFLIDQRPALAGLAVSFCAEPLPAASLVSYYDRSRVALADEERMDYYLAPIVKVMLEGRMTKAVAARCVDYLRLCGPVMADPKQVELVLCRAKLSTEELSELIRSPQIYLKWLMNGYTQNPPTEKLALVLAERLFARGGLVAMLCEAERLRESTGDISCAEHFDWLVGPLRKDGSAPSWLRSLLARTTVDPESLMSVLIKAAAESFAQANEEVQVRLWRAVISPQSIFDDPRNSFDAVTAEFISRDDKARARVSAKAAK